MRISTIQLSFTAFFLATSAPAALSAPVYTTIDVSGASATFADGVNANGTVAGTYLDSSNHYHGYVRTADGAITTFEAPNGATSMSTRTIDRSGTVIGWYYLNSATHGFLRTPKGKIKTFDPDGSNSTSPNAIADDGSIIGAYSEVGSDDLHGFFRTPDGTITNFDIPNAISTVPLSINSSDVVTGYYLESTGYQHGFIRTPDGTITTFDEPDAQSGTYGEAIDAAGDVVGTYWSDMGHGFVRAADGTFTSFQIGSQMTLPLSVNSKGEMTGFWDADDYMQHGFLRRAGGKMKQFDVPDSIQTSPASINDKGIIAGSWEDSNAATHGFLRIP